MSDIKIPDDCKTCPERKRLAGKKLLKTVLGYAVILALPLTWPTEHLEIAAYSVMVLGAVGVGTQGAIDFLKAKNTQENSNLETNART